MTHFRESRLCPLPYKGGVRFFSVCVIFPPRRKADLFYFVRLFYFIIVSGPWLGHQSRRVVLVPDCFPYSQAYRCCRSRALLGSPSNDKKVLSGCLHRARLDPRLPQHGGGGGRVSRHFLAPSRHPITPSDSHAGVCSPAVGLGTHVSSPAPPPYLCQARLHLGPNSQLLDGNWPRPTCLASFC